MFERHPTALDDALAADPMFAHGADGKPVTRQRTCECGASFRQRLLSERFLAIVDKRGPMAMIRFRNEVPDFFVPVHCPRCERVDVGRAAQLASYAQTVPDHAPEAAD